MDFVISLKWTTHSDGALDVGGEGAFFSLLVPLLHPSCRADGFEVLQEELARLVLLTLDLLAAVEVDIVLPAVPRLVLVWEPWVERNRLHLFVVGHLSFLKISFSLLIFLDNINTVPFEG